MPMSIWTVCAMKLQNQIRKCIQRKLLSCSRRLPTNNALGNQNEILIIDDDDGRKVDTNST